MRSIDSKIREKKIQDCLSQLESIHLEIMKSRTDSNEWRDSAEKSLAQQITVLRLWQGESRLGNNLKIALSSTLGMIFGYAINILIKVI